MDYFLYFSGDFPDYPITAMNNLDDISVASVIRTLIYYDVFNYPLSEQEILAISSLIPDEKHKLGRIMDHLTEQGIVHKIDGYFSLSDDPSTVKARLRGNKKAERWMVKAERFSRIIAAFPYIRGISVSGSLSKGFLGEDPDIDYFIITAPNRLWLARTLLVAFKKVFLLNSYKYFCINYFIDSENLEIEEKNLFTATEIVTMIPMYGNGIKEDFFRSNRWIDEYYPNYSRRPIEMLTDRKKGFMKKVVERILDSHAGDWLDERFMRMTINHWRKKFGHRFPEEEFQLAFKSGRRISKHHPSNFQKRVMQEFNKRKARLEQENNIDLKNVIFKLKEVE